MLHFIPGSLFVFKNFDSIIMMSIRFRSFFVVLCVLVVLSGCNGKKETETNPEGSSATAEPATVPLPTGEQLDAYGPENDLDTRWLFSDSLFALYGRPKKFLESPVGKENELFFVQNISQSLLIPFNLIDTERILIAFAPGIVEQEFMEQGQAVRRPALMFRRTITVSFSETVKIEEILAPILRRPDTTIDSLKRKIGSLEYFDLTDPGQTGPQRVILFAIDSKNLLLMEGFDTDVKKILENPQGPGSVALRLKRIDPDCDLAAVFSREGNGVDSRLLAELFSSQIPLPPETVVSLTENFRALSGSIKLSAETGKPMLRLDYEAMSEKGADEIDEIIQGWIVSGQTMLAVMKPEEQSMLPVSTDFAKSALNAMESGTEGKRVRFTINKFDGFDDSFAEGVRIQNAGARQRQMQQDRFNQLVFLGQAFFNYYGVNQKIATSFRSEDGTPLLSWRVALLPFLGYQELYDKFKLDEPWDSESNKALLSEMPPIFRPLGMEIEPNKTLVRVFNSEGTPLADADLKIEQLQNPQTTVLFVVVQPSQAVEWTRPDDLAFDVDKLEDVFGNAFFGISFAGMVNELPILPPSDPRSAEQRKFFEAFIKGLPLPIAQPTAPPTTPPPGADPTEEPPGEASTSSVKAGSIEVNY